MAGGRTRPVSSKTWCDSLIVNCLNDLNAFSPKKFCPPVAPAESVCNYLQKKGAYDNVMFSAHNRRHNPGFQRHTKNAAKKAAKKVAPAEIICFTVAPKCSLSRCASGQIPPVVARRERHIEPRFVVVLPRRDSVRQSGTCRNLFPPGSFFGAHGTHCESI